MEKRRLGRTGLQVSVLGFGAAEIGYEREAVGDGPIESLLNALLDAGVTLVDTAECYRDSEELIGRFIGHRRDEFTLTTKIGHQGVEGAGEDWSVTQLEASIDHGLKCLKTDRVDVIQLHSCSQELLEKGDVIDVLVRARDAGKTRFIGYSGDNEAARYAVESDVFDTLQTSFSVLDQGARRGLLDAAMDHDMGIIAKRPIGNGSLRAAAPRSEYARPYWERAQRIEWPDFDLDPIELALRYTLSFPVTSAIVGTKDIEHFQSNIAKAARGPLPAELIDRLNSAYDRSDEGWRQQT